MSSTSEKPTCLAGKRIIVAGAGIVGLTFRIALRKQWASQVPDLIPPTITIYERDCEVIPSERQGYSFSIRSDNGSKGMQTLQKLGLLDLLLIRSVSGKLVKGHCVPGTRLGKRFSESIRLSLLACHELICASLVTLKNGRVKVQFSDGDSEECDLLMAADQSRNKIRPSLGFDEKLNYQSIAYIMGNAEFTERVPPPKNKDYGFHLSGTGVVGVFIAALWQLSYRSPPPRELAKGSITKPECEYIIQEVLDREKDPATLIMSDAQDRKPFHHLTGNLANINVVFLGDANHAVTPFAGNSANLASMDGWDLAEQLCKHNSIENSIKGVNKLNLPRAQKVLMLSHWNSHFAHLTGWTVPFWAFVVGVQVKVLL